MLTIPGLLEAEAGRLPWVPNHHGLHKFQGNQVRPSLQNPNQCKQKGSEENERQTDYCTNATAGARRESHA